MNRLLTDEEIDNLSPTHEEVDTYLAEPDDEVAASLDPRTKRMVARIILHTRKVAQAQDTKSNELTLKEVGEWLEEKDLAFCNECEMLYIEPDYIKSLLKGEMPK